MFASENWVIDLMKKALKKDKEKHPMYENYSAEEKCIGCWVDGKPLYRCIYNTSTPSVTNTEVIVQTLSSGIKVKKLDGIILKTLPINYWYASNNYATTFLNANGIVMKVGNTVHTNREVYFILEYTKNSDASNSFTPDMITQ